MFGMPPSALVHTESDAGEKMKKRKKEKDKDRDRDRTKDRKDKHRDREKCKDKKAAEVVSAHPHPSTSLINFEICIDEASGLV